MPTFADLEVQRGGFTFEAFLGCGSFGEVWLARWNNCVSVAVKQLLGNGNMDQQRFLEEADIMHRMNHPRIVRLLAVCSFPSNEPVLLVTEFMENGSLKQFLRGSTAKNFEYEQHLRMMTEVAEGMTYLEANNFVHRDLRTSNILVNKHLQLKVADFGLSHILGEEDEYIGVATTKFPIRWTAPEGIIRQCYSIKSDVWSFGILMHEVVTFAEVPYKNLSSSEVRDKVSGGYILPKPMVKIKSLYISEPNATSHSEVDKGRLNSTGTPCPEALYLLMVDCWSYKSHFRPSFGQLYETLHFWMNEQKQRNSNCCSEKQII